jgi:homoaconitase/3-isopropylmalate dehydratase large subunit
MAARIWSFHLVRPDLLYVDLHLIHEVSSPQAFDGLRAAGRLRASSTSSRRNSGSLSPA